MKITKNVDRKCKAMVYTSKKIKDEYVCRLLSYMPSSNECFNGIREGKALENHLVPLLLLVKKRGHTHTVMESIPTVFYAPVLFLYMNAGLYKEHDLGVRHFEL